MLPPCNKHVEGRSRLERRVYKFLNPQEANGFGFNLFFLVIGFVSLCFSLWKFADQNDGVGAASFAVFGVTFFRGYDRLMVLAKSK